MNLDNINFGEASICLAVINNMNEFQELTLRILQRKPKLESEMGHRFS